MIKEYANNEVTVVWKPKECIHSEKCWHGLPEVFRPKEKPWINTATTATEKIVNQVKKCPSGALSYYLNTEEKKPEKEKEMEKVKVQVFENGPLMVMGSCEIVHKDGTTEVKEKSAFCRCGHSANKPFCDGSHKAEKFED